MSKLIRPVYESATEVRKFLCDSQSIALVGEMTRQLPAALAYMQDAAEFLHSYDPFELHPNAWWQEKLGLSQHRYGALSSRDFATEFYKEMTATTVRHAFIEALGYSLPTLEVLTEIKEFASGQRVREYMAGSGWWAYHLQKIGVNVFATDGMDGYQVGERPTFLPIHHEDIREARLHPDDVLMLSWIPDDEADDLLDRQPVGRKFIYIGESPGSCCATKRTGQILNKKYKHVGDGSLLKFPCYNDYLAFYIKHRK